jgi:hypothetical protein
MRTRSASLPSAMLPTRWPTFSAAGGRRCTHTHTYTHGAYDSRQERHGCGRENTGASHTCGVDRRRHKRFVHRHPHGDAREVHDEGHRQAVCVGVEVCTQRDSDTCSTVHRTTLTHVGTGTEARKNAHTQEQQCTRTHAHRWIHARTHSRAHTHTHTHTDHQL